mgnify:CR=1 FL=1
MLENESSPYHNRLTEVSSIETVTKRMVRITLASPNVNFPKLLDIPIYRAGTTDEGEFAEGTGPYKPVQNGAAWTLEANENWHGGFLGTIRHITLVKMTRADAADTSFRTGDVSIMRSARIAPDDQNIAFTGEVDTVPVSSAMLHYIGLNYNNSQFANAKVRQALSMAISRQGLCATQLQDYADPAVLPINPQPADTGVSYSLSADLMTAAQLLREAAQEGASSAGSSDSSTDSSDGGSDSTDSSDDDSDSSEEDGYYDEDGVWRSHAAGLERVPYDGYAALLHEGERVLTAREARQADQGGGAQVTITGNTFQVRQESDIDAIAEALYRKLRLAQMGGVR